MGCVSRATRALEGTDGVEQVTFDRETERFSLTVTPKFRLGSAAAHVRQAGKVHDRQLGIHPGRPWVLRDAERELDGHDR